MGLKKITEADLTGRGVIGMADTPNLSARQMQEKVEEVVRSVVIPVMNENAEKTATKQDLADAVFNSGAGDMQADFYDENKDGIVNQADNGLFVYTQSGNVLSGSGANGKFKAAAGGRYTAFTIDGQSYSVKSGGENEVELTAGVWYTFVLDVRDKTINFKSGGAGLNFKIVGGTTRPQNPRENTIWINTATAIGEYQFTAAKPERRADGSALHSGDIWLETGYIKTAQEFNALKKNGLQVYPRRAYQWNGTAFILKECRIYTGASWKDLTLYIYDNGWVEGFETKPTLKSNYGNLGSIGFYDTYILVACDGWASNYAEFPLCDITPYTTLEIFFASVSGAVEGLMGFIDGTEIGRSSDLVTAKLTLDISSYTGEHRIGAGGWAGGGGGNYQITAIKLS